MTECSQLLANTFMPVGVWVVGNVDFFPIRITILAAVLIFTEFVDEVPQLLTVGAWCLGVEVMRDFLTDHFIIALPVDVDVVDEDSEQSDEGGVVVQHA